MERVHPGGEEGFTILEAAISSMVLLTVMSSLTMLSVGSFYLTSASRQRQAATFLANQVIEEVRALPYQTVANGLSDSDPTIATDSEIQVTGSAPNQTYTYLPTGETIPHGDLSYTQAPLTPHQTIDTVNATPYTVSVYPTFANGKPGVFRVSATVRWVDKLHGNSPQEVSAQTLVYSPGSNCLSADTHPFSAPCQSSFYATVSTGAGAITVNPVPGSGHDAIAGIALTQAQLLLTQSSGTLQIEQISEVTGSAVTSGAALDVQGQPAQTTGAVAATSDANNDPAITAQAPGSSQVAQLTEPISYSNGNTLSIAPTTSDQGSTTSVVSAGTGPSCDDLNAMPQTNALPCGLSSVRQSSGSMTMAATIEAGSSALGSLTLASVGSFSKPSEVFLTRSKGSPSSYCPGATGQGCVHAAGVRHLGDVSVAGIPIGLLGDAPAGWGASSCNGVNALFQVDGFSDSVTAESGNGASSPSASQTSGTLVYWNGSGCSSLAIDWQATPASINLPTVTLTDPSVDTGVTVTIAATIKLGSATTSWNNPTGCSIPCTATAASQSPISASILYTITDGTSTLADMDITLDLGTLAASTSWQAAP